MRWLRPDYQIPRLGSDEEKAHWKDPSHRPATDVGIRPAQGVLTLPDDLAEMMARIEDNAAKPEFPANDEMAETAAVITALPASSKSLSLTEVASHFKGGKQNEHAASASCAIAWRDWRSCRHPIVEQVLRYDVGRRPEGLSRGRTWWRMIVIVLAERS